MLALLRFLLLAACVILVLAFVASIGIAWLMAHPEVKTFGQLLH